MKTITSCAKKPRDAVEHVHFWSCANDGIITMKVFVRNTRNPLKMFNQFRWHWVSWTGGGL